MKHVPARLHRHCWHLVHSQVPSSMRSSPCGVHPATGRTAAMKQLPRCPWQLLNGAATAAEETKSFEVEFEARRYARDPLGHSRWGRDGIAGRVHLHTPLGMSLTLSLTWSNQYLHPPDRILGYSRWGEGWHSRTSPPAQTNLLAPTYRHVIDIVIDIVIDMVIDTNL
jgi:hypothetical protein